MTKRAPNPMDDDVLGAFEDEWNERKAEAEREKLAAIEERGRTPRIETMKKGSRRLVRSIAGADGYLHDVAVIFTKDEWAEVVRTVLSDHGLAPATRAEKGEA